MNTYIYVKQHNITKLKYFGKTVNEPYKYSGSGSYWVNHIKKHGKDISTLEVWEFDDINECKKFAIEFSEKHNIVESTEWANLQIENGIDGDIPGRKKTKEEIAKRVATVTGVKRLATSLALKGKNTWSSSALKGRTQPRELVEKRANSLRGKPSGALGRTQSTEEKAFRSSIMKGRVSPKKGSTWSPERRAAYERSKNR
jgi:hypothetical protein